MDANRKNSNVEEGQLCVCEEEFDEKKKKKKNNPHKQRPKKQKKNEKWFYAKRCVEIILLCCGGQKAGTSLYGGFCVTCVWSRADEVNRSSSSRVEKREKKQKRGEIL